MMTITRFAGTTSARPFIPPERRARSKPLIHAARLSSCFGTRFRLVFAKGRRVSSYHSSRPLPRIAVLCQVGRSDEFFFKPSGGNGAEEEPFTKQELDLNEAISTLEPYDRSLILPHVSIEAMDAIQKTASGMLGMLPPSQFQIQIQSLRDPLANLVFSSLCTGYALRNAEYRLNLQDSLSEEKNEKQVSLNDLDEKVRKSLPPSALEYIDKIESELQSYKAKEMVSELQSESSTAGGSNRLLQYVRGMHPDSVNKLSESAGRGVVHAFNLTVKKVVENLHLTQAYPSSAKLLGRLKSALGEAEKQRPVSGSSFTSTTFNISRDNLTDALLWSMLVGYYTKGLECRLTLEKCVHDGHYDGPHSDKAWYLKLGSLFPEEQ